MNPLVAKIARAKALGQRAGIGAAHSLGEAAAAAGAAPGAGVSQGAAPGATAPGNKPGSNYHPMQVLKGLDTNGVLTGKQMREAARALTALEVRPVVHGYRQLANQLGQQKEAEAKGLGALGERLQGGVTDVYRNIAQSEAQNLARQQALGTQLNQRSGEIATQGQQDLTKMQEGQLGAQTDALALRGAPGGGSAQAELASAVAAQQARQSADSQAAEQFAASQGAGATQLAGMLGGAAQLQGGAANSEIARQITNRVASSNQEKDQAIATALGKLADAKATKGSTFVKNLLSLREGEQKFKLGEQAVHGEKEGQKLKERENAEGKEEANRKYGLELKKFGLAQWEAHHPGATSGETAKKAKEIHEDVAEVKSMIPTAAAAAKEAKKANDFEGYVAFVNEKTSAPPQIVRKVLKHWWQKRNAVNAAKKAGHSPF